MGALFHSFAKPRAVAAAVLVAGCVATLAVDWPGHLEFDSIIQLRDGRSGVYDSWHPPVMAWLLGLGDAILPGAALFVAFDTVLAFAALVSLLWLPKQISWRAVAGAFVIVLLPQLLIYQGIVWKDVLFADAVLCGFASLAQAAARWENFRARAVLIALSILFLVLATLTRQNGAVVVPCAAIALGVIAARGTGSRRNGAAYGAGLFVACIVLVFAGNAALQLRSDNNLGVVKQIKVLERYDLAGMVKRKPAIALRVLDKEAPALARAIRTEGVARWSPAANDTLMDSPVLQDALDRTAPDILARQWREAIATEPGTYLAVRAQLFVWLFWPGHGDACPLYTVGVDGPANWMNKLSIAPRFDARDEALDDYASALGATPVFWHPAYAVLTVLCLWFLLKRRGAADIALAAMLTASLLFTLSFFFVSMACEYRYLYMPDLAAAAAALYLLADGEGRGTAFHNLSRR
jgi:hypothetical protein